MANDPREDVVINPEYFFVPDDVIDVRASTGDSVGDFPVEVDNDVEYYLEETFGDDAANPGDVSAIQTPGWLTVVSQQVRVAPDGRSVIDVTLEAEDVAGAIDYQLRVTK